MRKYKSDMDAFRELKRRTSFGRSKIDQEVNLAHAWNFAREYFRGIGSAELRPSAAELEAKATTRDEVLRLLKDSPEGLRTAFDLGWVGALSFIDKQKLEAKNDQPETR